MADVLCVDSDILIDVLREKQHAIEFFAENAANICVSVITAYELYHGAFKSLKRERNVATVDELISRLTILPVTPAIARKAGEILASLEKRGTPLPSEDLLIGTTAAMHGIKLKTRNVKEFSKIPGLMLV